jgi:hypothetical protein
VWVHTGIAEMAGMGDDVRERGFPPVNFKILSKPLLNLKDPFQAPVQF